MTLPLASVDSRYELNINEVIRLAVDASKIIMESGGETYRAQDIFTRIAKACGMTEAAGFVIPTGIIATVTAPNGQTASITRLLPRRSTHLERIARVHAIAEDLECHRINPVGAQRELSAIQSLKPWPAALTIVSAGIVAAFFMLIFGGQWTDFPVAFAIGAFLRLGLEHMGRLEIPSFFTHAVGDFWPLRSPFWRLTSESPPMQTASSWEPSCSSSPAFPL